jgi:integrase
MLRHPRTGRAFIFVRDERGRRRQLWLGADWGTPEAQRRYHEELAKWHVRRPAGASAVILAEDPVEGGITIVDAAARWLLHCEKYYRRADGTLTKETSNCVHNVRPLLAMFGDEPLAALSPRKLKEVRERMIRGDPAVPPETRRGWCRTLANQAVGRIRSFVKWCVAEGLVSPSVHAGLCALAPLKRGRTDARESKTTRPVSDDVVEATLPHLPPVVADMVRLQHLVGMRGGELCAMASAEIDRSEAVHRGCWVFRPSQTKVSYRGRAIEYPLGPKAVAIIKRYLKANPTAPLFSPAESELQRHAAMRARRKTRVQPSQVDRAKPDRKRRPGDRYDSGSYGHCIRAACRRAGVEPWSPHDLRRAVATRVRSLFGAEAARAALAHQTLDMTALYAHRDLRVAAEIASEIG